MPTTTEPPAVHVEYVAPASCPPASVFLAGLSGRGVRLSDSEDARRLTASVVASGPDGFVGTVSVGEGGAERHVRGHACSEVVSALAFVASLEVEALERQAGAAQGSAPNDAKGSTMRTGVSPDDGHKEHAGKEDGAKEDAAKEGRGTSPADGDRRGPVLDSFDLGVDGAVVAGPLPAPAFALPLFVEAGFPGPRAAPLHLRLRFQQVGMDTHGSTYGAHFTAMTGSIELSAMLLDSGRLRAFAGARVDAGALAASGKDITPALSSSRPWVTVGPDLRARAVIAGPFFAEVDVGLPFTLTQDRFFVAPDTTVHRPGPVGAVGAVGLGFTLF